MKLSTFTLLQFLLVIGQSINVYFIPNSFGFFVLGWLGAFLFVDLTKEVN